MPTTIKISSPRNTNGINNLNKSNSPVTNSIKHLIFFHSSSDIPEPDITTPPDVSSTEADAPLLSIDGTLPADAEAGPAPSINCASSISSNPIKEVTASKNKPKVSNWNDATLEFESNVETDTEKSTKELDIRISQELSSKLEDSLLSANKKDFDKIILQSEKFDLNQAIDVIADESKTVEFHHREPPIFLALTQLINLNEPYFLEKLFAHENVDIFSLETFTAPSETEPEYKGTIFNSLDNELSREDNPRITECLTAKKYLDDHLSKYSLKLDDFMNYLASTETDLKLDVFDTPNVFANSTQFKNLLENYLKLKLNINSFVDIKFADEFLEEYDDELNCLETNTEIVCFVSVDNSTTKVKVSMDIYSKPLIFEFLLNYNTLSPTPLNIFSEKLNPKTMTSLPPKGNLSELTEKIYLLNLEKFFGPAS